jgi:hypothetical protein
MSDEIDNNEGTAEGGNDDLKNFKSEFQRKFGNQESKIEQLMQSQQELISAITSMNSKKGSGKEESAPEEHQLSDLLYSDPEKYAKIVEERVEKRITSRNQAQQQEQQKHQEVLVKLTQDYPELTNSNHELTLKAVDIYSKMSDYDRSSPLAYQVAVKEAADELDIKPSRKRKVSDDDDFSFSGGNSGNRTGKKGKKLDPKTIQFAEMMGLDVKDKKVLERLQKHSERNFVKYGRS